jgi:hypothetical protein
MLPPTLKEAVTDHALAEQKEEHGQDNDKH